MPMEDIFRPDFDAQLDAGWRYFDMPGKMDPDVFDSYLQVWGEGEYKTLILSQGKKVDTEEVVWRRGQFLLSPIAWANMKTWREGNERSC